MNTTNIHSEQLRRLTNTEDCCNPALNVKIDLPETDIVDCDGNVETVEALPTAPMGVQKVEICNATPDVESVTYCNKDTDTQWLRREIVTFDTDGVPTVSVLSEIDLGVSCTDPQPDIEEVKLCVNGTEQIQFYRFITNEDQSATTRELIDTIDTGIACNETRGVDVLTSCDGTTKSVEVKDSVATQVVFDSEQLVKVSVDKSCEPEITSDIITDCDSTSSNEIVDSKVSIVGSENPIQTFSCGTQEQDMMVPMCVDGEQYYAIYERSIANSDDTEVKDAEIVSYIYPDMSVSKTAPTGTDITIGACRIESADYEMVSDPVCMENTTTGERFRVSTYANPTDSSDNYKVWVDANGDVVAEPTGVTPCVSECSVDMHYERCFNTGSGIVTVAGYFEKDSNYVETYKSARVIASTDPAFNSGDDVISESWLNSTNETTCAIPTSVVNRTTVHARVDDGTSNVYSAPFKSFSVTSLANGVTVNGQEIPKDFTISLDSNENEQHITDHTIEGSDYFVTYVV